jgi:predicted dinucleotide-binding enzyme
MRVGILGSGSVGRALAEGCTRLGHEVTIGTRDVDALMARNEPDQMGTPPFSSWHAEHGDVGVGTFAEAGRGADLIVNATVGTACIDALGAAGVADAGDVIVIDTSNPLDFSKGFPPSLFVCNTDSLGEQIQRAFPSARVVKAWNTMTSGLMVHPEAVAGGDHTIPICGNDDEAKARVVELLTSFGWRDVLDVGDIAGARGMEAYLLLWLRLLPVHGTSMVNAKVVR